MVSMKYTGCVYMATCRVNGKSYIGKSIRGMVWRRKSHERRRNPNGSVKFLNALKKHGPAQFDWCELFLSDDDAALMTAEVILIAAAKARGETLYNMTIGGDGASGRKDTQEVRDAKAKAARERPRTIEEREKLSRARMGMKFSPEHRANIAKARVGKKLPPWTPERRAKYSAAWALRRELGIVRTDETRRRQSEAAKNRRRKSD